MSGESLLEHTFIDGWEYFLGAVRDGKEQTVSMSKGYNFADGNAREARSCMLCKSRPKITSHATMGRRQRGRAHTLSKLTPWNLGAVITGGPVNGERFPDGRAVQVFACRSVGAARFIEVMARARSRRRENVERDRLMCSLTQPAGQLG